MARRALLPACRSHRPQIGSSKEGKTHRDLPNLCDTTFLNSSVRLLLKGRHFTSHKHKEVKWDWRYIALEHLCLGKFHPRNVPYSGKKRVPGIVTANDNYSSIFFLPCGKETLGWPRDSCPAGVHSLYNPPLPLAVIGPMTFSKQSSMAKVKGFCRCKSQSSWFWVNQNGDHPGWPWLSQVRALKRRTEPCMVRDSPGWLDEEQPCGRGHMVRSWGGLRLTTSRKLGPLVMQRQRNESANNLNKFGSRFFPSSVSWWKCCLMTCLLKPDETLSRGPG